MNRRSWDADTGSQLSMTPRYPLGLIARPTELKGLRQCQCIVRSIGEFLSFIGEFLSIVSRFKMRTISTHQNTATSSEKREMTRRQRGPNRHPSIAITIVLVFWFVFFSLAIASVTTHFGFAGTEQWQGVMLPP